MKAKTKRRSARQKLTVSAKATALHDGAMEFADRAIAAKHKGDIRSEQWYFARAFELEMMAAYEFFNRKKFEPTRSILFRSAASLAITCNLFNGAIELANIGLNGNPPSCIRAELMQVLMDARQIHRSKPPRLGKPLAKREGKKKR